MCIFRRPTAIVAVEGSLIVLAPYVSLDEFVGKVSVCQRMTVSNGSNISMGGDRTNTGPGMELLVSEPLPLPLHLSRLCSVSREDPAVLTPIRFLCYLRAS